MRKFRKFSMGHKHVFESIDRTMQNIRKKNHCHLGDWLYSVLLAGDWRQILPVVRHGSRPDIVDATLKSSYLWQIVTRLQLTQNMRSKLPGESSQFADFLLSIGDGRRTPQRQRTFFHQTSR